MRQLLTAEQAGERLQLSKWRMYELAREGLVPCVRIGERQIRFTEQALDEWIARGGGPVHYADDRGAA